MSKEKKTSGNKKPGPFAWLTRGVMGTYSTVKDDRYDSPSKLAVKRFSVSPLPPARLSCWRVCSCSRL